MVFIKIKKCCVIGHEMAISTSLGVVAMYGTSSICIHEHIIYNSMSNRNCPSRMGWCRALLLGLHRVDVLKDREGSAKLTMIQVQWQRISTIEMWL